jgi:hypothetical protein
MSEDWKTRAVAEMNELAGRVDKLRAFLLVADGPEIDNQVKALMQAQYQGMVAYYDALVARLRLVGVVDVETPPLVRESKALENGAPAAVDVTVTAPVGKRADVSIGRPGGSTSWTVTGGQSQTWSVVVGEALVVCEGEPHSTVAHKRDAS